MPEQPIAKIEFKTVLQLPNLFHSKLRLLELNIDILMMCLIQVMAG
ncbi:MULTISPECIES: hypothetical protein [Methanobacterium]|jgi:hypothetical protein|uniref:Uncharacterized protein n=1 Tax=Methanobacterium veterum TaxID=408577 RepID=A0A9E4ZZV7_9EURY|nr:MULTISPECIES: hypothetical protein [Methanobacterium]MCZ3372055.1 hypothetical protein [Methanobacterium veterum]